MEEDDASANPIYHSRAGAAKAYSTICFKGWLKLHAESFDVATVIENVNTFRVENLLPLIKYLISSLHVRRMSASSNLLCTTESQNYTIVGVGRDLRGSSSPTPLPKQGHLQQAAQDLVQAGLEYLQRRRLHNLPGQPVPVLRTQKWIFHYQMADSFVSKDLKGFQPLHAP